MKISAIILSLLLLVSCTAPGLAAEPQTAGSTITILLCNETAVKSRVLQVLAGMNPICITGDFQSPLIEIRCEQVLISADEWRKLRNELSKYTSILMIAKNEN